MQWGIESVSALAPLHANNLASGDPTALSAPEGFAALMRQGLGELNTSVGAAESAMGALASGKPVELHDVMISLERARISVQTFVQVRNKLIESYQDLMRMQL